MLGAGELGQAVLRHLCERATASGGGDGADVSVLLRPATIGSDNPGKRRDLSTLRDLGIRIVPGDLAVDSPDDLAARFRGFHTVVGCTGFVGGSGTQRKLARAVLDAGGRRYVPWQFGVDYDALGRGSAQNLFDEQLDVRDLLRGQSRTAWVLISTGLFTSFLFEPSFGVVDLAQNVVHALGSWDNAVTVTAPEDIGRLTAAVLFAEPAIVNQVVYTAGDTITYGQLADTVDAVLDRRVERVEWSLAYLRDDLARHPEDAIRKYRVAFGVGRGVAWPRSQTFNAQQGIETVDVARWIQQNLRTETRGGLTAR